MVSYLMVVFSSTSNFELSYSYSHKYDLICIFELLRTFGEDESKKKIIGHPICCSCLIHAILST